MCALSAASTREYANTRYNSFARSTCPRCEQVFFPPILASHTNSPNLFNFLEVHARNSSIGVRREESSAKRGNSRSRIGQNREAFKRHAENILARKARHPVQAASSTAGHDESKDQFKGGRSVSCVRTSSPKTISPY